MFITSQSTPISNASINNVQFNDIKSKLFIVTNNHLCYFIPNITPIDVAFWLEETQNAIINIQDGHLLIDCQDLKTFALMNIGLWQTSTLITNGIQFSLN